MAAKAKKIGANKVQEFAPVIGIVVLAIIFQIATGGKLLTGSNIKVILNTLFTYLIVSIGATFVYTAGGMDMSVGGLLGICALLVSVGMNAGSALLGLLLAVLMGALSGFINGGVQVMWGIPPFVMSLCLRYIYRGILVTVNETVGNIKVPSEYQDYDNTILKFVVLVAVFAVAWVLFYRTRIGKAAKAIGGNSVAAEQSGISVRKYTIIVYIITGICVAIASFFTTARQVGVVTDTGSGLELNVLVSVVIGGLGIRGGAASSLKCCLIGSVIVAMLNNGLVLAGVPSTMVEGIKGLLFLVVVFLTYERRPGDIIY
ncbi:MAG: ABC transporter permease [Oscillospiraceae bacterium]|jgi:ribose transport system permease protein